MGSLLFVCSLFFCSASSYVLLSRTTLRSTSSIMASKIKKFVLSGVETFENEMRSFDEANDVYMCFHSEWCPDCAAASSIPSSSYISRFF